MTKIRNLKQDIPLCLTACTVAAVLVLFYFGLTVYVHRAANFDEDAKLHFVSIRPSLHHGVYIHFRVTGHSQISKVFIRAYPPLQIISEM